MRGGEVNIVNFAFEPKKNGLVKKLLSTLNTTSKVNKFPNLPQRTWGQFLRGNSVPLQRFLAEKGINSKGNPKSIGGAQTRKRPTEYQLRALSELSYRSPNVAKSNVKRLHNKQDKKMLAKLLNRSTRKIRRRN